MEKGRGMSSLGILQALVFEPRKAFTELAERPRILFPLLLLLAGTAGLVLWYYQVVDLAWLTDQQLRARGTARQLTDAQLQQVVKTASENAGITGVVAAIVTAIVLALLYALVSAYYLLAGKITNVQRSFRQWFSLACWTSMPSLLTVITGGVVLLMATNPQIQDADLRVLSLNSLLFHKAQGEPGYALLSYIGLPELLSIYLAIMGIRVWSGRSWLFSTIFALLPVAIIGAVVAMVAMGRA
jgi:hypothetical protein